jgi:hypothetical protein
MVLSNDMDAPNVVVKSLNTPASYSGGPGFKSRPGDRPA